MLMVVVAVMSVMLAVAFLGPLASCASFDHVSMNLLSGSSFDEINSMLNGTCIQ